VSRDVLEDSQTVLVAAVGMKHGNRVFIGGIERLAMVWTAPGFPHARE